MAPSDYAFTESDGYHVDRNKYKKHYSHECVSVQCVPCLLDFLHGMNGGNKRNLWDRIAFNGNSMPVVRLYVKNYEYEQWEHGTTAEFVVDTGARVSILTAETANALRIDRDPEGREPTQKIRGIGDEVIRYLPRWVYVSLGGVLHPIPVLVPPADYCADESPNSLRRRNYLGRAGITSCFLVCFDNKRLYAFARRDSEPVPSNGQAVRR